MSYPLVVSQNDDLTGTSQSPQSGLLIASPHMMDPNFARTVVLLFDYDEDGALGLVLNREAELTIGQVAAELPLEGDQNLERAVHWGGPVAGHKGFVLYGVDPSEEPDRGSLHISKTLRVSPDIDVLSRAVQGQLGENFLLALGHAGWLPGQLDNEIQTGSWLFTDVVPDILFQAPIEERYDRALMSFGVDPSIIMMRPIDE